MKIEYGKPVIRTGPLAGLRMWLEKVGWFIAFWVAGVVGVGVGAELLKKIIFGGHG